MSFVTYSMQIEAARKLTDVELMAQAEGCSELFCVHHGPINEVRRERRRDRGVR